MGWLDVVVDVLEVDVGHVDGEPLGYRLAFECMEVVLVERTYLFGFVFLL